MKRTIRDLRDGDRFILNDTLFERGAYDYSLNRYTCYVMGFYMRSDGAMYEYQDVITMSGDIHITRISNQVFAGMRLQYGREHRDL